MFTASFLCVLLLIPSLGFSHTFLPFRTIFHIIAPLSLLPPPPSHAPNIPIRIFLPSSSILSPPPPLWHARVGATVAAEHPQKEATQPVMEKKGALAPHAIDGGGDQK